MSSFVFTENIKFAFQDGDVIEAGFYMDHQSFRFDPSTIMFTKLLHIFFGFWNKIPRFVVSLCEYALASISGLMYFRRNYIRLQFVILPWYAFHERVQFGVVLANCNCPDF